MINPVGFQEQVKHSEEVDLNDVPDSVKTIALRVLAVQDPKALLRDAHAIAYESEDGTRALLAYELTYVYQSSDGDAYEERPILVKLVEHDLKPVKIAWPDVMWGHYVDQGGLYRAVRIRNEKALWWQHIALRMWNPTDLTEDEKEAAKDFVETRVLRKAEKLRFPGRLALDDAVENEEELSALPAARLCKYLGHDILFRKSLGCFRTHTRMLIATHTYRSHWHVLLHLEG